MGSSFVPTKLALLLLIQVLSSGLAAANGNSIANINIGCLSASRASGLTSSPGNYDQALLIPKRCALLCIKDGTKLAGVTEGNICLCGNTVKTSVPNAICDATCPGNASLVCGGETTFNAYNVTSLLQNSPKILFQTKLVLFETASFRVVLVNETYEAGYRYNLFYDPPYTYAGYLYNKMFDETYNHTFTAWGDNVQLFVIVQNALLQEFKQTVPVNAVFRVSSLYCPTYILVGEQFECSGRLYLAKEVNVTWEFDGLSKTMSLPDPVSLHVGSPVPRWTNVSNDRDLQDGLVLCLTCTVTQPLIILAWEMNAIRSGTVDLVILRPICSTGLVYCPTLDACCFMNSEFSSEICDVGNSFCGSMGICNNNSIATCGETSLGEISLKNSYSVVYNNTLHVQQGYNLKLLPSDDVFEFLPGDVLCWIKTNESGIIAIDPKSGKHSVLVNLTTVSPNSTITLTSQQQNDASVGTSLLAGLASRSVNFLLNITAASKIGTQEVTFTYDSLSVGNLTKTHSVYGLNAIGNVSFDNTEKSTNSCAIYAALNETFSVFLHISSGTMAKVIWNVENTTIETNLSFRSQEKMDVKQNFTFSSIGEYFLSAMVSNPLSGQLIHVQIIIQEKITGLSFEFTSVNDTTYQGIKRGLTASFVTGTNVTFKWFFGDESETEHSTQATIEHAFRFEGQVNTTVEASNMVSAKNVSRMLNVSNPVEMVLPPYGVNGTSVNLTCQLPESFTDAYIVIFEIDNTSMVSSNCNTIQYNFTSGLHHLSCTIKLGPTVVSQNGSLFVLEPITGLEISAIPPIEVGKKRLVETNITTGNNVSYSWNALEQLYDTSQISAKSFNFSKHGKIKVSVNASNAISQNNAEILVTVQEPVGALMVNTSSNPSQSKMNISFNINKTSGTEVNYTVNISDRVQDLGPSNTFTDSFVEGIHYIFVRGKNYISESNVTYRMAIQDPLVYPINISCPGVWDKNDVCVLERNRMLPFSAKTKYATNVSFTWSWDNTGNQTSSDKNPSEKRPVYVKSTANHSFSKNKPYNVSLFAENDISHAGTWINVYPLDLITGFKFSAPTAVPIDEDFPVNISLLTGSNVTFSFDTGDNHSPRVTHLETNWTYSRTGVFLVRGMATNRLNNATHNHTVVVQEKIISIKLLNSIPVTKVNVSITVNWEITGGTNVSTLIRWGDGNKVTDTSQCTFYKNKYNVYNCADNSKAFAEAKRYTVNLTAYNLLSTTASFSQMIIIQDPIIGLTITTDVYVAYIYTGAIVITISKDKGTSVKYSINTGDGRIHNTSEQTFTVKYSNEGVYKISVVAYNEIDRKNATLNGKIDIKTPRNVVKITALKLTAKPTVAGTVTELLVSYKEGAVFTCDINFGDQKPEENLEEKAVNVAIYHNYSVGEYDASISCKHNSVFKNAIASTKVLVHEKIKHFRCLNSSTIQKVFRLAFSIHFSWSNGSHVNVFALTNSDKSSRTPEKKSNHDPLRKSGFINFPNHHFKSPGYYIVYFNASNAISSMQTNITVHLIEQIANLKLLVNPFVSVNYTFLAYLQFSQGSELNVTWNFGDGSGDQMSNCTWKETCSLEHIYKNNGTYVIKIHAKNPVSPSGYNANDTIVIEYPILGWKFFGTNKTIVNTSSFMTLMYNSSFTFPTDATYTIDYGDDKVQDPKILKRLSGGNSITEEHIYIKSGCYYAVVKMENKVSFIVLKAKIEVRGVVDVPTLFARTVREGTLPGDTLPIEYPVKFNSSIENKCLKFNWTVRKGNEVLHVNHSMEFFYKFEHAGTYDISLNVYDDEPDEQLKPGNTSVRVDTSVTGLYFSSDGIAKVNDNMTFVLLCSSMGTFTFFEVDYYGNGSRTTLSKPSNITEKSRNDYNVPFDPIRFYGVIFYHAYTRNTTYDVTLYVRNSSNNAKLSNKVVIEKAPCSLPDVKIVGANLDYKIAPDVPYEVQYTLFSEVEIKCKDKIEMVFSWNVFKADVYLLDSIGVSLPPQEDMKIQLKSEIRTNLSSLTIPRKGLQPGLYIFQLSISFPDLFADTKYIAYLRIQRPPLIVLIKGGSARSVPWDEELVLNASHPFVIDPLKPTSNDDLTYRWRCTQKENRGTGGCFGSGEQLYNYKNDGIAKFRSRRLVDKITYQFTVIVSTNKGVKTTGRYTQEIRAIPGKPPVLSLRCVSNCAAKLNPYARLSIESTCEKNCDNKDKYEWSLIHTTSSTTTDDIWPNKTLTERDTSTLVVKAGTFYEKHTYTLQLNVTSEQDKTGFVSYDVEVNSPPYGGICEFFPKEGVAMKTHFNFTCRDWKDDQERSRQPLTYKLFYTSPIDPEYNFLVYHGSKVTLDNIYLPSGPKEKNYTYTIILRVEDVYGAYNKSEFQIQVKPDNITLADSLKEFRNKTSTLLKELVGSGDIQGANRLAVSLVNEVKSKQKNVSNETGQIFHDIVKTVSNNLPEDLDSMRQSIETVVVVVNSDEEVLPKTQIEAMNAFIRTSQKLRSEAKHDIGNDEVEDLARGLLSGIGSIMKSSSFTQSRVSSKNVGNTTVTEKEGPDLDYNTTEQTGLIKSKESIKEGIDAITDVTSSILEKKVKNEKRVLIETKDLEAYILRANSDEMNGSSVSFSTNNTAGITFPEQFQTNSSQEDPVDIVGLFMKYNPYITHNTSDRIDSSSVSLELKQKNGDIIKVEKLVEPLIINVPREKFAPKESINQTETKLYDLIVHKFILNDINNAFIIEITPEKQDVSIALYFRKSLSPTFTSFDFNETLIPEKPLDTNTTSSVSYFLNNSVLNNSTFYVGVGSRFNGEEVVVNYTFRSYEIGCYYWSEEDKMWITKGCTPAKSTEKLVQCLCNHATLFGSNFFVTPNTIDVKEQILNFGNLADYPALLATICVITGFYIIAMVWATRKDRREAGKVSLHVSADNEPDDRQRYEVIISTGSRRNAGSTAEISIVIYGDQGDSQPCLLQRTSAVSYQRSSRDSYLVTTSQSLGSLLYIRIWHDNSGIDPSWFLSEVIIRDVETGKQHFFVCNSWLACDEGDGLVERLIPVASTEELKDFQYLFMQNSSQGFSDGHLWFSIILRPAQSRFTHAQRISCCLCLLLCTMLSNAMFYQVEVKKENNVDVDIGPYQFTWHEVMVGIQSSLVVFPLNLLIVSLFRRIAAKPRKSSKYLIGTSNSRGKTSRVGISLRDIELEKNRKKVQESNERGQDDRQDKIPEVTTISGGKKMWLFPWWFVYIAWFILICVTLIAAFFTLLYGLSFGKKKQEKWLTALLISVFQDVLISQPIKIFALALLVAFVIRKPNPGDVNEENEELMKDKEWIQESWSQANPDGIARKKIERKPPDELILKKTRLFRQKERKMFQVFREVIQYFFFWWIVLMISYGYRESDAHLLTTSMEKTFVTLGQENDNFAFKRDYIHDIYKTKNRVDLLKWLHDVVIPGLSHEKWYNNKTDLKKNYISDSVGYLVGDSRLRLLRIKKDTCKLNSEVKDVMDGCESEYSFSKEYQVKYNRKDWIRADNASLSINEMWEYKSQSELYERPFFANLGTYRGGGYVLKLRKGLAEAQKQIKELNKTRWIDGQTRAVFVEFTVFSPNKNLHCIVTIVFECPASGGCTASYEIISTRLDEFLGNYRLFVLACELVFILFILNFTYKTFKRMIKQGASFWKMFWNWMEIAIITLGWCCLGFYILRLIANKWTKAKFHDDRENFVSFRYVATADKLYGIVLAFVVFLTSIKFLRLFRFNRRMSLLGSTLKYASWDLMNFMLLFSIAFIACVCIAYLLFQNNIDMFSSMVMTTQTLMNIILGKFKYMNLSQDTFVASVVVLVVYVVVVVFILINVFVAILNDAFQVVKRDNDLQENEHEIVDYITGRFKSWIGIKSKPSKLKSDFEHEYGFRPKYVSENKHRNEIPATVFLDRKVQELMDFVDKQANFEKMEEIRLDECKDEDSKKAALLLLMS